jgi:molecular chaperone DnaK
MIKPMLDQTLDSVKQVLRDAKIEADQLQQVLLVGGSSYIPAVWELLANHLDIEPQMSINPEEVVALGAGVQAAIIAGEPIDAILVDVTPHSLGIAVANVFMDQVFPDQFKSLIRRNTTIPTSREEKFYTIYPDQDTIRVEVYQGEDPVASNNTSLGNFLVTDLKSADPDENAEITVQFDLDVNGILKVTARDRQSKQQKSISVEASHTRMSEAEILAARDWADKEASNAGSDDHPEEGAVLLRRAEALLDRDLGIEDRQSLSALLKHIHEAQTNNKSDELGELLEKLEDLLFDLDVE